MLNALDQSGWASMPEYLGEADSLRLRGECEKACDLGEFKRAGVGRGANLRVREDIRRDHVLWLEPGAASVEQGVYLAKLELLRLALNQRFFLGLFVSPSATASSGVGKAGESDGDERPESRTRRRAESGGAGGCAK